MQPWVDFPRDGFTEAQLREALALGRGAHVRHGVEVLDVTDTPTGQSLPFEAQGGYVNWDYRAPDLFGQSSEVSANRRKAHLTCAATSLNLITSRLRIWTEWQLLNGDWARWYLGVFTATNPGALADDGLVRRRDIDLADKSYLWGQQSLNEPLHLDDGTAVVSWVKASLTAQFGETRFAITSSDAILDDSRTFEAGTSYLTVYNALLEAIAYDQLTSDELGRPASRPLTDLATVPEATYGAGEGKVLTAGQVGPLLPSIPNVVRFVARQGPGGGASDGNGLRIVRNQSTGPASIDARGGLEVELRVEVDADSQDVLDAVAAAEAQQFFAGGGVKFDGTVGLNPRHSDRDVIALALPRLGLAAAEAWQVTSWRYPLGGMTSDQDALMPITAERRVSL